MYQCVKCKFRKEFQQQPKRCPNCGTTGSMVREVKASELVRDVDELI